MPYYAWSVPTKTSVWYDSVELFRQKKYGNWDAPLAEIRDRLRDMVTIKEAA
jgi:hypothetical protein